MMVFRAPAAAKHPPSPSDHFPQNRRSLYIIFDKWHAIYRIKYFLSFIQSRLHWTPLVHLRQPGHDLHSLPGGNRDLLRMWVDTISQMFICSFWKFMRRFRKRIKGKPIFGMREKLVERSNKMRNISLLRKKGGKSRVVKNFSLFWRSFRRRKFFQISFPLPFLLLTGLEHFPSIYMAAICGLRTHNPFPPVRNSKPQKKEEEGFSFALG